FSFFFSSRRRHTRSKRDWSSDVCSSDLLQVLFLELLVLHIIFEVHQSLPFSQTVQYRHRLSLYSFHSLLPNNLHWIVLDKILLNFLVADQNKPCQEYLGQMILVIV